MDLNLFQVRHAPLSRGCAFNVAIGVRCTKFRQMCTGGIHLDCPEQVEVEAVDCD